MLPIDPVVRAQLWMGLRQGLLAGTAALTLALPPGPGGSPAPARASGEHAVIDRRVDLGGTRASADVRRLAAWIVAAVDNGPHAFAIVDKRDARVYLFKPSGRLIAASPVLLGYARGDDSVAGIGLRPVHQVRPGERTTPAGRHAAQPGRNAAGEDVLWVDYEAAVSMHRVRPGEPAERRLARLASPSPRDNRISYGCINLPSAFFDEHFWPNFGTDMSIVFVLPETRPLAAAFPALAAREPDA